MFYVYYRVAHLGHIIAYSFASVSLAIQKAQKVLRRQDVY
jgi:hypothetical protein